MREPNEPLPVYLDNYCQWVREEWHQLDEQDLTALTHHIRHNDLPETAAILSTMAESEGFCQATPIFYMTWHQALLFSKELKALAA